jgi:hypothetical protein
MVRTFTGAGESSALSRDLHASANGDSSLLTFRIRGQTMAVFHMTRSALVGGIVIGASPRLLGLVGRSLVSIVGALAVIGLILGHAARSFR